MKEETNKYIHTSKGRGGSVSRRDHDQAYWRRAQLSGGTKQEERRNANAIRSSGEGVWGRGASLREAASPPESPHRKALREGARGRGLLFREAPSLAIKFPLKQSHDFAVFVYVNLLGGGKLGETGHRNDVARKGYHKARTRREPYCANG